MTQTLELQGKPYVLLPLKEFEQLRKAAGIGVLPPPPGKLSAKLPSNLPPKSPDGTRPAAETVRAILAHRIIRAREAAGLSQADLARLADMHVANLNRIERAKVMPDAKTIAKIEKTLAKKGQKV